MALATDVILLDDAQIAINAPTLSDDQAAQLETMVSAVSELLDNLCGPIVIRTVTDELHDANGSLIFLRNYPVASVTTVTEYLSGTGTVLTAEAVDTSGGFLLRDGVIARRSGYSTTSWNGTIKVTYEAGRYASTATVESRFKQAAAQIVASEWANYSAAWTRGDPFAAPDGGALFGESVQKIVNKWLANDRRPPGIA